MQNILKLYTKKDCAACENVKEFLKGFHVPENAIQILDITNDLVMIGRLKDGIPGVENGEPTMFTAMSFPSLEVIDKASLQTIGLITPSASIIEFISMLNFPPVTVDTPVGQPLE